jgi:hypothetical protein
MDKLEEIELLCLRYLEANKKAKEVSKEMEDVMARLKELFSN